MFLIASYSSILTGAFAFTGLGWILGRKKKEVKKRKGSVHIRKIKHFLSFSLAGMCHMAIPLRKAASKSRLYLSIL